MPDTPQLPIFVITLDDCTDRQKTISSALANLGLSFEFVPAIDGRKGLPPEFLPQVDRVAGARKLGREISDAECAAALSHARVYQGIIDKKLEHALIFEDDAILTPDVGTFATAKTYQEADIVLLNHLNARVFKSGHKAAFDGVRLRALAVPCFRAAAYSVSYKGAAWLLERALPVTALADWPADITEIGALALDPEIVHHPPETPGQSTLAPGREKRGRRGFGRMLDPTYARRVWRKAQSEKIS
ncbi:MAG: glycosyltransferase family 25 protein [Pseudomonadota bacterium]